MLPALTRERHGYACDYVSVANTFMQSPTLLFAPSVHHGETVTISVHPSGALISIVMEKRNRRHLGHSSTILTFYVVRTSIIIITIIVYVSFNLQ